VICSFLLDERYESVKNKLVPSGEKIAVQVIEAPPTFASVNGSTVSLRTNEQKRNE